MMVSTKLNLNNFGKKGFYSILTSFIFVVIFVAAVIGIVFYETNLSVIEGAYKDSLSHYEVVKDARNKIYYCYGNIVDPNKFTDECNVPIIQGYNITRMQTTGCSVISFQSNEIKHFDQKFSYTVAIKEAGKVCPGKLTIYY